MLSSKKVDAGHNLKYWGRTDYTIEVTTEQGLWLTCGESIAQDWLCLLSTFQKEDGVPVLSQVKALARPEEVSVSFNKFSSHLVGLTVHPEQCVVGLRVTLILVPGTFWWGSGWEMPVETSPLQGDVLVHSPWRESPPHPAHDMGVIISVTDFNLRQKFGEIQNIATWTMVTYGILATET